MCFIIDYWDIVTNIVFINVCIDVRCDFGWKTMVKSVYITDGIANVDETDTSNQKTTVGRRLHLTEDQSEDYTRQKINQRRLHLTKDQSEDYTRQKTNQKTTLGRRLHSTEDQSEDYTRQKTTLDRRPIRRIY
jgi:uncharacterized membrane-anchored protein